MTSNPYVFVVGCPRSGTTLLQRMLDHHSRLAVTNDTHLIPRVLNDPTADASTPLTPDLIDALIGNRRFPRLGVDAGVARSLAEQCTTYARYIARLYDHVAEQAEVPFAGEKTPDYVRHLPLLHRLFPTTRSVHIVRDGRDVALSILDWASPTKGPGRFPLWQHEPIAVAALWWAWQVGTGRRDGRMLRADQHTVIRYESLVDDTESVMRTVSSFLAVDFEPSMLEFHVGRTRASEGRSAKGAWLPPTPGLRTWRTSYTDDDLALVEALAGDELRAFGYELSCPSPSDSIIERAERCRQQWDIERAARRGQSPSGGSTVVDPTAGT